MYFELCLINSNIRMLSYVLMGTIICVHVLQGVLFSSFCGPVKFIYTKLMNKFIIWHSCEFYVYILNEH